MRYVYNLRSKSTFLDLGVLALHQRFAYILMSWTARIFQAKKRNENGSVSKILHLEDKSRTYDTRNPISVVCETPRTKMWKHRFCFRAARFLETLSVILSATMGWHSLQAFQNRLKSLLMSKLA